MTVQKADQSARSQRLSYIDWLRVLATLGVFLFHAVHPFDVFDWEIKNAEQSMLVSLFVAFFVPWGMPLFFLVAGASSGLALRRRTARQYINERLRRLLIPFVVGAVLLSPVQLFFHWRHVTQTGLFAGTLREFVGSFGVGLGPRVFGAPFGYHLWFLGFLFAFSVLALPLFLWLERERGTRLVSRLATLCGRRGGILVFVLPLVLVRFMLQPQYPIEHDWADFLYMLVFFIYGYILYTDERFTQAVRRDWSVALPLAIISFLAALAMFVAEPDWMSTPNLPWFYAFWALWGVSSWTWTIVALCVAMRFLDSRNRWLDYGQEAIVPFFLFHQPVIIAIAYFIVQRDASILAKLLTVILGSFGVTLGLYELLIRRAGPLRALLGIKLRQQVPRAPTRGPERRHLSRR